MLGRVKKSIVIPTRGYCNTDWVLDLGVSDRSAAVGTAMPVVRELTHMYCLHISYRDVWYYCSTTVRTLCQVQISTANFDSLPLVHH